MTKIAVIGSASMDLTVMAERRPNPGETIIGESFQVSPGGKGANQAVAAAKLGADVTMLGCVGDDTYGQQILTNFKKNGVATDFMKTIANCPSGIAHITLVEGDNSIIVIKGANDHVTPAYVEQSVSALAQADMVILQLEIPLETVAYVADFCEKMNKKLLLNPAPAAKLDQRIIEQATFITPNEHEFAVMFGVKNRSEVLQMYPNKLIITEGENGARYFDGKREVVVPAHKVEVVDTTGAGDTFNGAFAVAILEGKSVLDAIKFANLAAAISITRLGAQGGMPTRDEVERMMK